MSKLEEILEFDKIKKQWMELALTDAAKTKIRETDTCISQNELQNKLRETSNAKEMIEKAGNPPLISMTGLNEMMEIAKIGGCLSAKQLEEIEIILTGINRLKDYLYQCRRYEISLAFYDENLNGLPELREEIHQQIRDGRVDDYASKLLKSLRAEIDRAESKMREKADTVMRTNKECMSDTFSTFRNGHICIPVKKEYKFRISGSVIDKSSTGNTLFIEPTAVAKYYEELQSLRIDEENEVRRILYTLTAEIADANELMNENSKVIEKLDYIFSKGKLSLLYNGTEPKINTERRIILKDARHPVMNQNTCVPLQFHIGDDIRGIVITGPNTGGKTVAIKTVAISCMMAQCGLHVACKEADICMNSNYLCDIGDGQNLSENLSTFSAHIMNVLDILKRVNKESLVIMDELGSGTDPTEGMGIAISILNELRKSGALFLVTTHYPQVKQFAQNEEGMQNARMTFDKESLKPLYQMVIGQAGESCAFYIAQKLGMPDSMLKYAITAAYGKEEAEKIHVSDSNVALLKESTPKIKKKKEIKKKQPDFDKFNRGDSVMIYPDKKIGIVCQKMNEKGVLQIQLSGKKIWINHKRVKLLVSATQLYPDDYDFSIVFDCVEHRKLRHQMERKYVKDEIFLDNEEKNS